jgi:hypothetical protein
MTVEKSTEAKDHPEPAQGAAGRSEAVESRDPVRDRPDFPKGYGVPETLEGLLDWRWAEARLERAKNYWICTTRPDGKPHARPIWGAWIDQSFFFDGGGRWSAYLQANPQMTVHLESGDEVVIVEGRVAAVQELAPEVFAAIQAQYGSKYDYKPEAPQGLYRVRPRLVFCWTKLDHDPTRFRFNR